MMDAAFNEKMWKSITKYLDDNEAADRKGSAKVSTLDDIFKESMSASIRNILNENGISERRHIGKEKPHVTKSGMRIKWASGTQNGYYTDQHNKPNQDRHACQICMTEKGLVDWFGFYDGNGLNGHECADFTRKALPEEFEKRIASAESLLSAMEGAHIEVHKQLIAASDIETEISGTTATTLMLVDDKCIVSNVGDSPVILGWHYAQSVSARFLCKEHTTRRTDERDRIKRAGGVVMSVDQRDDLVPNHEKWREEEAPRVWSTKNAKLPRCAFTRSIGNGIAHTLDVTARPEFSEHRITKNDRVIIVASDSITDFMDEQTCVEIACAYKNSSEAVQALIHEASERWISRGDYMDDITVIVVFFDRNEEHVASLDGMIEFDGKRELVLAAVEEQEESKAIGIADRVWTLLAGATSGLLGGLCDIRGPLIILYFLHPPRPVKFDKKTQRATGAIITATNVAMRMVYYLVETFAMDGESFFTRSDWILYACVVVSSMGDVLVGSKIFDVMKDSRNTIRMILSKPLAFFVSLLNLLLCWIIAGFTSVP